MMKLFKILPVLLLMTMIPVCSLMTHPVQALSMDRTFTNIQNNTEVDWNSFPKYLNVTINNTLGDTMNINWSINISCTWTRIGSNFSCVNGTYYMYNISAFLGNFDSCSKAFTWSVNLTNATAETYNNNTYNFSIGCNTTIVNVTADIGISDTMSTLNSVFAILGVVLIIGVIMGIVVIIQKYK